MEIAIAVQHSKCRNPWLSPIASDEALKAGLGDFIRQSSQQPGAQGSYAGLIQCLRRHTGVDVAAYLEQWISHNARIDLSIQQVSIQPDGSGYSNVVVISVTGDRDYEMFTSLGYKTATSPDWVTIPVHWTARGEYSVRFTSQERPILLKVDPDYLVPQTIYNNDKWH